ncbi:hypothetical protein M9H77_14406 [Catharanthus roseus]|uniref:Uncharacterized protein n=1 Tax=Catharanthus roseus TaxID=4058 RepID=A0ACC0BN64_CATRO|nr:hypothetical protein M9H77_14406 [Catharanthus roseus]
MGDSDEEGELGNGENLIGVAEGENAGDDGDGIVCDDLSKEADTIQCNSINILLVSCRDATFALLRHKRDNASLFVTILLDDLLPIIPLAIFNLQEKLDRIEVDDTSVPAVSLGLGQERTYANLNEENKQSNFKEKMEHESHEDNNTGADFLGGIIVQINILTSSTVDLWLLSILLAILLTQSRMFLTSSFISLTS